MPATVRRAGLADAAALTDFAAHTFRDTYEAQNTAEDMREYLASAFSVEKQTMELGNPDMVTLVAESDGRFVGYTQLLRRAPASIELEKPIEVYRFYVDRSAHGTGVAQSLMAEALATAREMGGGTVWLGVWEKNPRAIAFYMKSGFREVGTQIFTLGSDKQKDRVLSRSVSLE